MSERHPIRAFAAPPVLLAAWLSLGFGWAHGDSITVGDVTYVDVLVYSSRAMYYVRLPDQGSTVSVPRVDVDESTVRISGDPAYREELKRQYDESVATLSGAEAETSDDYEDIFVADDVLAQNAAAYSKAVASAAPLAPPLTLGKIFRQGPVPPREGGITVVEFWATWCGPCRQSIPHLSAMQAKFAPKGIAFVGVTAESPAEAAPFVREMGNKMNYTVAADSGARTSTAFARLFGVTTIPHAYIIGTDGKVAWHGHPMDPMFESILDFLAG